MVKAEAPFFQVLDVDEFEPLELWSKDKGAWGKLSP